MEKDYLEKVMEIKNEILGEIRELIPNARHEFKEAFCVHYIDGELATSERCHAVEVSDKGVSVDVSYGDKETSTETIESYAVFCFDTYSLIDILNNLKSELREEKLSRLRELVAHNGKKISFDGSFKFDGIDCGEYIENCRLDEIELVNGALTFKNTFGGDQYVNDESFVEYSFLDEMIAYVEKQTRKKFTVKVTAAYSRMWEIEASTSEEAKAIAAKMLSENPLNEEDADGKDWWVWQE